MIYKIKSLGLAWVAVVALGAAGASTASASALTSDGPVTLTGTETGIGQNRSTAFGAFIECPGSTGTGHAYNVTPHGLIASGATTYTATGNAKETTATGAPNCIGPFGWSVTLDQNGCDSVVHIGAKTASPADTYGGTGDIVCPAGKEGTVTIWTSEADHTAKPTQPFCILHIPPQTGLKGPDATDTTNGTIDVTGSIEGIRMTRTSQASDPSPVLCANSETTTGKADVDGTITGRNAAGGATSISLSGS